MSYEKEVDIDNKLDEYLNMAGMANSLFRPQKTLRKTGINLYSALEAFQLWKLDQQSKRRRKINSSRSEIHE
jgi:hypothetical protein